ncbi:hypothetical protein SLEP1_g6273 [Rubroshorea leprosula]|uniref:Uncharacterized protein n=1 Tax=Rubroshorea leprosula TaxID=152421 RepID=A0AAV5I0Y8_9ROSI|nr:hypothetical protein SLEP1_g6273 [Rubroshorea leprosula]
MGSPTSNLNHYFFVFVFLFLFLSSLSCPISCDQTLDRPESSRPSGYRVFYVKNARPLFLINRRREVVLDSTRRRTGRMMIKRKKNNKVTGGDDSRSTRPFTVMLPKGFVPPSGSSPCHNENPNSAVTSYCELSNSKP